MASGPGARIAVAGVVIGMLAAFGLTRYLEKLLFAVSPQISRYLTTSPVISGQWRPIFGLWY